VPKWAQYPSDLAMRPYGFSIVRTHHKGDSPGFESSIFGSVTFDSAHNLRAIQAGGQEAWVLPLFRNWLQVSGFAQVVAGQTIDHKKQIDGTMTVQGAVGAQALVTPNFRNNLRVLNGHIQVGIAGSVGLQGWPGDKTSSTASGGFVINWNF
jgi:hypothetical protein